MFSFPTKAFDCINCDVLHSKLECYRIRSCSLNIIKYETTSNNRILRTCVPLGLVIRSVLYIIANNDLRKGYPIDTRMFADEDCRKTYCLILFENTMA